MDITTTNELVRTDCLGRTRVSVIQREAILDAYEISGLSGPQFAAHHGVKYQTFATWLQKRRRASGGDPTLPAPDNVPTLILAEVEAPVSERPTAKPLEIHFPGEAVLYLSDFSQVSLAASLLRQIQKGLVL